MWYHLYHHPDVLPPHFSRICLEEEQNISQLPDILIIKIKFEFIFSSSAPISVTCYISPVYLDIGQFSAPWNQTTCHMWYASPLVHVSPRARNVWPYSHRQGSYPSHLKLVTRSLTGEELFFSLLLFLLIFLVLYGEHTWKGNINYDRLIIFAVLRNYDSTSLHV